MSERPTPARPARGAGEIRRIRIPPPPPTLSLAPCTMKRKARNENLCGAQSRDRERVRLSALGRLLSEAAAALPVAAVAVAEAADETFGGGG